MKKIKFIGLPYDLKKKYNINTTNLENWSGYFLFDDDTIEQCDIYEFGGYIIQNNLYFMWGHEEVRVYNENAELLQSKHTR